MIQQVDGDCKICLNCIQEKQLLNACNHQFCSFCLSQYLQQIIDDNKSSLEYFKCPECNKLIDEKLFLELIDEKHKQQYHSLIQQKLEKQQEERELILFYLRNKQALSLCRCPWCGLITEKKNGCNFVRCYSPQCEGKFVFCAQCDECLEDTDHDLHYEKGNSFNGRCRIKVNNQWVDRSKYFK